MVIVSTLILPHGAMTFDGRPNPIGKMAVDRSNIISESQRRDCNALFAACSKAAEIAKATSPDVIVLNTPHGVCLSDAVGVYLNADAKGSAEWNGQWNEFEVNVILDKELAGKMIGHLRNDGISAEGICTFAICETPLRWGEVIPLWFLQDFTKTGVKVVIFSNPINKMRGCGPLPERANIGHSVAKFLRGLEQRVLYVVSGDLAHTHETDCQLPLYLPDPRSNMPAACDTALPFDLAVENWVKGIAFPTDIKGPVKNTEKLTTKWDGTVSQNAAQWLAKAIDLSPSARSCGIYGFGILHGLLVAEIEEQGGNFTAHFLCRLAPTYYGMMVAAFVNESV